MPNDSEDHFNIKFGIFSKTFVTLSLIFYCVSYFNKNFALVYANIPLFTFSWFEVFRFVSGVFVTEGVYDLMFNILISITVFNFWENKEGTTKFTILFWMLALLFQGITNCVLFMLQILFPDSIANTVKPIPSLGLVFLIKHLLMTESKFLLTFKGKINNRLFLVFLYTGFILLNLNEFKVEWLLSPYLAFVMCKYNKQVNSLLIDEETILQFEKNESYKSLFKIKGWVLIEECFFQKMSKETSIQHPVEVDTRDDLNLIKRVDEDSSQDEVQIDLEIN